MSISLDPKSYLTRAAHDASVRWWGWAQGGTRVFSCLWAILWLVSESGSQRILGVSAEMRFVTAKGKGKKLRGKGGRETEIVCRQQLSLAMSL